MKKTLVIVENYTDMNTVAAILKDKMEGIQRCIETGEVSEFKNSNSYVFITSSEHKISQYDFNNVVDLRHSTLIREQLNGIVANTAREIDL